jgi:two-component system, OmpR family, phosphate regulon sensor histidine kinase PhoR
MRRICFIAPLDGRHCRGLCDVWRFDRRIFITHLTKIVLTDPTLARMKILLQIAIALTIAALLASIWISPWIAVTWLLFCAGYYAWFSRRQQREVTDLLRDPTGAETPFSEAIMRIRQRVKEGEQGLREREAEIEQRKQITNAVPDGLFLLDRDNRIVWCNQAALTMHSLDAFRDIGKPIGQLIRAPEFLAYLDDPSRGEPIIAIGERSHAFRIEEARDGARLLLSRDVTEREKLDRMRRDFVANVSHEMRTPLTVVTGYIESLRDLPLDRDDREKYLALIATQTGNMRRLVEDLLILARLENDQVPIESTRVALHTLAQELFSDAQALSAGRHRLHSQIDTAYVVGSASELRSAIGNLLSNAVRYTPSGGSVWFAVQTTKDNEVSIEVRDSGVGIAAEHIPRLTERFYRVDRSRSRETGGTGLGLAIVKHVAQRHRGTLEIESVVGEGSTFRLRLPSQTA